MVELVTTFTRLGEVHCVLQGQELVVLTLQRIYIQNGFQTSPLKKTFVCSFILSPIETEAKHALTKRFSFVVLV